MNICCAILSSFQKFLRSTENSELHSRYFSIFSSFTRKITLELTLAPEGRKDCVYFCKFCKDEYDKAVSESPSVPDSIVLLFRKEFSNEVNKPEIANGLFHFNNYSTQIVKNGKSTSPSTSPSTPVSHHINPSNLEIIIGK